MKRKHSDTVGLQTSHARRLSDNEIDISDALYGTRATAAPDDSDDSGLDELIHETSTKRDVKIGTQVIRKLKDKGKIVKGELGGGSFQSMGLHPSLLRSLTLQGYRIPTPIQRLSIPSLLANPPRDLVGMARTGSGKSLAYLVPLVQRLNGRHSTTFGTRALVLIPTRELALQILKVGKELTRGWSSHSGQHAGDKEVGDSSRSGQNLRWGLIVGGESLDEQFEMITNNPDIIIATPGRLLHLAVEMNLDLKSVEFVVFDEADRLFEMGFETALTEIIHRLPPTRQTLLFSATLPKSLVEFAKAGLQEPKLVRLDAESKISSDLKMAFFLLKQAEKEACLLSLLRDTINVPIGTSNASHEPAPETSRKHKDKRPEQFAASHQTLIFVATKHHVEFLSNLLSTAGYAVSYIYGSLDQSARTYQMDQFRQGNTNILVVTDVAARGIDIPVLANVINYDFPQGARVFVHRVGRTARAGRQGWAWSFVNNTELPYFLDLQLFLGRPLRSDVGENDDRAYVESLVLGTFERTKVDDDIEYIRALEDANHLLSTLRGVMQRGHALYERSRGKASPPSYKRAKEMMKDPRWSPTGLESNIHPVLLKGTEVETRRKQEEARRALLRSVTAFTPSGTVFEIGSKGGSATNVALMKDRRKALNKSALRLASKSSAPHENLEIRNGSSSKTVEMEMADEDEIVTVFGASTGSQGFRDSEFYISHHQKGAATEKGYSLGDGASFVQQVHDATFDLTTDDGVTNQKRSLKWDKKKKRFIRGDGAGADNVKIVKTENGTKLPATYRSGRFDEWKAKTKVTLPTVGQAENESATRRPGRSGGKRFRHHLVTPAKPLDKLHASYERKVRRLNKKEGDVAGADATNPTRPLKSGRYGGKPLGKVKSELKNSEQIRKHRKVAERRRAKNARPKRIGGNRKGRR